MKIRISKEKAMRGAANAFGIVGMAMLLTLLVALISSGSAGCAGTPARVANRAIGVTETTVEASMRGWNDFIKLYHPPLEQERQVKAAFESYQKSALAFLDAQAFAASLASSGTADQ